MANRFVLYDGAAPNSDGSQVLVEGMDLNRFLRNPVMFYMHMRSGTPFTNPDAGEVIGRWENIKVEGNKLLADAVFDESQELGSNVAQKVERGFLRGASVGLTIDQSKNGKKKVDGEYPLIITKSTVLEASIADIPKNTGSYKQFYLGKPPAAPAAPATATTATSDVAQAQPNHQDIRYFSHINEETMSDQPTPTSQIKEALELPNDATEPKIVDTINELKAKNASLTNCNSTLSDEVRNRKEKAVEADFKDAVKEGVLDACEVPVYKLAYSSDPEVTKDILSKKYQTAKGKKLSEAQKAELFGDKQAYAPVDTNDQKPLSKEQLLSLKNSDPAAFEKAYETALDE